MFFKDARAYIMKLIRIQTYLLKKGYARADQPTLMESLTFLKNQLSYYRYDSDDKMRSFFDRHHDQIRILIPNESYPGFRKLMNEFINLQNQ